MKHSLFLILFLLGGCTGASGNDAVPGTRPEYRPSGISLTSSDRKLEQTFIWARDMALSYAHDGSDPVGYWYEAALPGREAFCMRDVSHQATGAWLLGLGRHNLNMMTKFVRNISDSKDWCTYWEIDRHDRPCPADYTDDSNFWYNLNANFDVMQACLKMYRWTGDETYIKGEEFTGFYRKTMHEYMDTWGLTPDRIMTRPVPHSYRGIASYVESRWDMRASLDLLASIVAGCRAYEEICTINGDASEAGIGRKYEEEFVGLIENEWWNGNAYRNFLYEDGTFGDGEGSIYLLWFDASSFPERIKTMADRCNAQYWNIENQSYMPEIMYRYGYDEEAYSELTDIPGRDRSDYPEASYGVIAGIVAGLMGVAPDCTGRIVATRSHLLSDSDSVSVTDIPVFEGYVSVSHEGKKSSALVNNTSSEIIWRAAFAGTHESLNANGTRVKAIVSSDPCGNPYSYADITVEAGTSAEVSL